MRRDIHFLPRSGGSDKEQGLDIHLFYHRLDVYIVNTEGLKNLKMSNLNGMGNIAKSMQVCGYVILFVFLARHAVFKVPQRS